MAGYPAGPYILEIPYVVSNLSHSLTFNCDVVGSPEPGDLPGDVTLRSKSGDGTPLDDGVNAIWALFRPFFNNATLASTYTLWKVVTSTTERQFLSSGTLSAPNGGSATAANLAHQTTFTMRSAKGGIAKIVLLESALTGNASVPIMATGDAEITDIATYILSGANWIMARDRSFPVAAMNYVNGQNEIIFNRRYRS